MKTLPWNASKSTRLQQRLDDHLLAVLRKRLAAVGIPEEALEERTPLAVTPPGVGAPGDQGAAQSAAAAGCPMHAAAAASSNGTSNGAAAEECPFHTAADSRATSPVPSSSSSSSSGQDPSALFGSTKDILSLALKLSVKDGALDREQLLSQVGVVGV